MKEKNQLSELEVDKSGLLCERVNFGNEEVIYPTTGVTEHKIYGVFFTFSKPKAIDL